MTAQEPRLFSAKPLIIKCPACSVTFDITAYVDGTLNERCDKMQRDYEQHFRDRHSREDDNQAAAERNPCWNIAISPTTGAASLRHGWKVCTNYSSGRVRLLATTTGASVA